MLTAAVLVPLVGAIALALWPRASERTARGVGVVTTLVPLVLLIVTWGRFEAGASDPFQLVERIEWIPQLGASFAFGVDGIGLAVAATAALLFVVAVVYPADTRGRPRQYVAWFLFLDAVSLGLFLTVDLLLFYVFFDLSLVGMYFLISSWGHGDPKRAALKFFLYTLAGSLVMLLGVLAIYLGTEPRTFDMAEVIAQQPLAGEATRAGLALLALMIGLGIKSPVVPFHTWLPPAHVDAPGPASTILAGVLLKMGTFGMIRLPYAMLRDSFQRWAFVIAVVAVISIVYGALVAFGQRDLKRRIAYTSVNHMGYTVLGVAAAGALIGGDEAARELALTGATVEMVAHGLITGALFLIAGSFWQRGGEYDLDAYGGLAGQAPKLAGATTIAAFASLGLPGLAGFVAEFHVFVGTFSVFPVLAAVGLLGILITAALFLQVLQELFLGDLPDRWRGFPDLVPREVSALGVLLALTVLIGVWPGWLLDVVRDGTAWLVGS
ncbi:MAG: NADH-quinone oxidoreductase subunit M [Actinobacteria bacterium]|nr:NADH-quinone oxidoreductase subunit M [Actinomycetota bacterium]